MNKAWIMFKFWKIIETFINLCVVAPRVFCGSHFNIF